MASAMWRFAVFWVCAGIFTAECDGAHHPLCRTLESDGQQQPTHFPSAYTCSGDNTEAVCSLRNAERTLESLNKTPPEDVIYWVYGGQRHLIPEHEGDQSGHVWLDCADYYAYISPPPESAEWFDAPPGRDYSEFTQTFPLTVGRLRELRRSEGNAQNIPVVQELKVLPRDDSTHHPISVDTTKSRRGSEEPDVVIQANQQRDDLVYAPDATCDDMWLSWPAMQEEAIAAGTVLVFDVFNSVGNLFIAFEAMIKLARLLELGLILTWSRFPGFRQAFNPGEIDWALDPQPFIQQANAPNEGAHASADGLHTLKFLDYNMVLSDSQLELLASTLDIAEPDADSLAVYFQDELPGRFNLLIGKVLRIPLHENQALRTQPCTWNMLLRRSPSMMASLEQHSPWATVNDESTLHHQPQQYIAWHIRTSDGETVTSYTPNVHRYVIQEPSPKVCPTYLMATQDALQLTETCYASLPSHVEDELVYISSNSKSMARDCTLEAANHDVVMGHVDIGLNSTDAHTAYSRYPMETALSAFLDFLMLMDSTVIVRTGSSFSGTVVGIKGLRCEKKLYDALPMRMIFICLPSNC